MSKIEIYKDDYDVWNVVVDGVNLAGAIADGGLKIEIPSWPDPPLVHMTLRARRLNVTLPEATIKAVEALLPGGDA